ncbi:hypothetical protein C8R47DRAFT_1084807 [Mycena vitilis]|nr:hypothetical protein C8R47DRAFT_1084807 [Mycena vitilis]
MPQASATSTQFASARTRQEDHLSSASGARPGSPAAVTESRRGTPAPSGAPSPVPSGSAAPRTNSPFAPTGLTAKVVAGGNGEVFLIEMSTGLHIEVIDDENVPTPEDAAMARTNPSTDGRPTLSEESDMVLTQTSEPPKTMASADTKIADLVSELGDSSLTREQLATTNQLRGTLATGRDRLFTTTSMVLDTQNEASNHHSALEAFKAEVAQKFAAMHSGLYSQKEQMNKCVAENVKVLRDLGLSESMLGQILASAAHLRFKSQPIAKLPAQELPANIEVESEIINGAHTVLPPRRPGETLEEFGRRAEAMLNRKGRVVAAFAAPSAPRDERVPDPVRTDENRGFTARFEDVGSISTAPRRPNLHTMASSRPATAGGNSLSHTGYLTANEEDESQGDVFEAFVLMPLLISLRLAAHHHQSLLVLALHRYRPTNQFFRRICLNTSLVLSGEPMYDDYGGSQYDDDQGEPATEQSADLGDLLDQQTADGARLGTMRYQYFSMRIDGSGVDDVGLATQLMNELPDSIRPRGGFGDSPQSDLRRIQLNCERLGQDPLTEVEEQLVLTGLRQVHKYPLDPELQFAPLATQFEASHPDDGPWTQGDADEWEALLLLQLTEHLRDIRRYSDHQPLAITPEPSSRDLALMEVSELESLMIAFNERDRALNGLRIGRLSMNQKARETAGRITYRLNLPRNAESPARPILDAAWGIADFIVHETADSIRWIDRSIHRRRPYLVRLRYEHSLRVDLRDRLEGPVEHPDAIPTVIISDFEDSDEEDIDVEIPGGSDDGAPPRVGGTPPPPYPGSKSDGESEMWETLDTEATEGFSEEPSPANDDPPLRLSAMRATRSALYEFTPYGPVPPLPHHLNYVMMSEEELFAQGESSAQEYARARQVVDRDEEISTERQRYEQEWASREESKAISARIRRELAWDEDPGSHTRPSNPDEPMDERPLWIRGNNFDYGERFVSVNDARMNEVEFEVNTTVSEATGESPFILQYGDTPMPALAPPDQLSDNDDHPHPDTASNSESAQYTIVDHSRLPPVLSSDDECILRSLVMLSDRVTEQPPLPIGEFWREWRAAGRGLEVIGPGGPAPNTLPP